MGIINDIKKDAKGNGTKIQSSDAIKLEKILNKMFYLKKNVEKETEFVNMVMTRGTGSTHRVGLHASGLIAGEKDFCLRFHVLSLVYEQAQGEQLSPGLLRIFEEGNAIHEKWQRLFIRAGYSEPNMLDKTQYNKNYRISFTPDIICYIPEFYPAKMVGEIKSVNTMQFKKMDRHPSAWKQLQWYMFLTGIHKGFVLSEDKNNQDFRIEIYDFEPENVIIPVERAETIKHSYKKLMKKKKLVARPEDADTPDCKRCEKCALRNACWKINGGGIKL